MGIITLANGASAVKETITRCRFIDTLKANESVHCGYDFGRELDDKAIALVVMTTDGKPWHPDDDVRTVTAVKSNHIVFSNGSRLYFDGFSKRRYTSYSHGTTEMLVVSILENGCPATKTRNIYYLVKHSDK